MKSTPLPEEWIEKFDERFGLGEPMPDDVSKAPIPQWSTYKQQDIKIFIRSLLHQSYEQGKREMAGEVNDAIDGMGMDEAHGDKSNQMYASGFNKAVEIVKENIYALTNERKEKEI